jgi:hypothetical protein
MDLRKPQIISVVTVGRVTRDRHAPVIKQKELLNFIPTAYEDGTDSVPKR